MNEADVLEISRQTFFVILQASGPVMLAGLVVGLVVSIFQVVTQIQEATLSFVPKIVAVIFTVIVFGPWMMSQVVNFATRIIGNVPSYF